MARYFILRLLTITCLIFGFNQPAMAQREQVITLPNVDVDTLSYPALRILRQLQEHEKEDRLASIHSFDVLTEGNYRWEFRASKFMKNYLRGALSVLGFPRISKVFIGNDLVTHQIYAKQHYAKGKLKDVDVHIDSANIELTKRQHDLVKRYDCEIEDYVLAQFRSPRQPWGSKGYKRYEWLLLDTLTMYGHRVDVLQFSSRPSRQLSDALTGREIGKVWIIEDDWRVIRVERQNLKNRTMMKCTLDSIAPGVYLPSEMAFASDFTIDVNTLLEVTGVNPDSLSEKQKKKLDKKILKVADCSMYDGYQLRMRVENVETK